MGSFNRERVATALRAGKISADEDTISDFDKWLYVLAQVYHVPLQRRRPLPGYRYMANIKCHGPSKELKKLDKALREWINADFESKEIEADLIDSFNLPGATSIWWLSALSMSISITITWLEAVPTNVRQQQVVETAFFIDLYEKYAELSGKRGLSDDGPAIRFIAECASILDMPVPQGLRRRIQQAIVARGKNFPPARPLSDFSAQFETIAVLSTGSAKQPAEQ